MKPLCSWFKPSCQAENHQCSHLRYSRQDVQLMRSISLEHLIKFKQFMYSSDSFIVKEQWLQTRFRSFHNHQQNHKSWINSKYIWRGIFHSTSENWYKMLHEVISLSESIVVDHGCEIFEVKRIASLIIKSSSSSISNSPLKFTIVVQIIFLWWFCNHYKHWEQTPDETSSTIGTDCGSWSILIASIKMCCRFFLFLKQSGYHKLDYQFGLFKIPFVVRVISFVVYSLCVRHFFVYTLPI
jgi:hypothetical protein